MAEQQHTPGPWALTVDGTCSGAWFEISKEYNNPDTKHDWTAQICRTNTAFVRDQTKEPEIAATYEGRPDLWKEDNASLTHEETQANARLIVASPDLLSALADLLKVYADPVANFDSGNWGVDFEPVVIAARAAIAKATQP